MRRMNLGLFDMGISYRLLLLAICIYFRSQKIKENKVATDARTDVG